MVNPTLQAEEFKRRYNILAPFSIITRKPMTKKARKKAEVRARKIQRALDRRAKERTGRTCRRQSGFSPRNYNDAFDDNMPKGIRSNGGFRD